MFWILKSLNFVWKPSQCTILAYFLAASLLSSSDLLGPGADHLARAEDQGRGPGLPDPHDHGSKPLGVVLGIPGMQGDLLQIQLAAHVDSAHDVLQLGDDIRGRGLDGWSGRGWRGNRSVDRRSS